MDSKVRTHQCQPTRKIYIHQLCVDTECNLEELQIAMVDREGWVERVKIIHAFGTPWWYVNTYIYIYIYICWVREREKERERERRIAGCKEYIYIYIHTYIHIYIYIYILSQPNKRLTLTKCNTRQRRGEGNPLLVVNYWVSILVLVEHPTNRTSTEQDVF